MAPLSRREFLACTAATPWVVSGTAASDVSASPAVAAAPVAPPVPPIEHATGFVDHKGWLLTIADRDALAGREHEVPA